jgi:DNA invertase Pin-like site-specific DNA recombinase
MICTIGYARTSILHQGARLEAQLEILKTQGCDNIFSEQVSSVGKRAKLDRALEYVREGDVLVVTKLDRLAPSVAHLCEVAPRHQTA